MTHSAWMSCSNIVRLPDLQHPALAQRRRNATEAEDVRNLGVQQRLGHLSKLTCLRLTDDVRTLAAAQYQSILSETITRKSTSFVWRS